MRASFSSLRAIERDLNTNLVPLLSKMGSSDIGVNEIATVIYHGLRGYDDTRLSFDQVGDAVMQEGLTTLMQPVFEFLAKAMDGVKLGKPVGETA